MATMAGVLGAAAGKTSLLDELTGSAGNALGAMAGASAKDAPKFASELEAATVKAGAHVAAQAPTAPALGGPAAKVDPKDKSKAKTAAKEDEKDADEKDDDTTVAPDAQLLAMAQAMTAPAPAQIPADHAVKLQAAMHDAMNAAARGEATPMPAAAATAAPSTTAKIDISGMKAVTPQEAKELMQHAPIPTPQTAAKSTTPALSQTPSPAPTPTPAPSVPQVQAPAPVFAHTLPAFTFTPPAAHIVSHDIVAPPAAAPALSVAHAAAPEPSPEPSPAVAADPAKPAAPAQAAAPQAPTNQNHTGSDSANANAGGSGGGNDSDPTKPDVMPTAADFMTAPAVSAPAVTVPLVNVPTTVKPMTAAAGGVTKADPETTVRNAEAVGHKRVLASGDAQGALTVEDLGRFEVKAHSHDDGRVDVQVRADHREGAAALENHAAELRADVRVELPRANVQVQTSTHDSGAGNMARERQREASEGREYAPAQERGGAKKAPATTTEQASTNRRPERVRIVL